MKKRLIIVVQVILAAILTWLLCGAPVPVMGYRPLEPSAEMPTFRGKHP
ncbi:MAG: hypothetical protein ACAH83_18195 [Alphaproteobacteria bacterium]